jgi:hypothetical protein
MTPFIDTVCHSRKTTDSEADVFSATVLPQYLAQNHALSCLFLPFEKKPIKPGFNQY